MPGWQDFTSFSQQYLSNDLLLDDLTGVLNLSLTYFPVIEHGISALSVSLTPQTAGVFTVTVSDASGIVPTWSQRQTSSGFGDVLQFSVPYAYTTISALKVVVTAPSNQVVNCPTFIIGYGTAIAGSQGIALVRPDGREYPMGSHSGQQGLGGANGPATVVAAPGAGVSILLLSCIVDNQVAGALLECIGTQNGSGSIFNACRGISAGLGMVWPAGLLCDPNTAVVVQGLGNPTGEATVMYDLVA
jgi:hypothetical protein